MAFVSKFMIERPKDFVLARALLKKNLPSRKGLLGPKRYDFGELRFGLVIVIVNKGVCCI